MTHRSTTAPPRSRRPFSRLALTLAALALFSAVAQAGSGKHHGKRLHADPARLLERLDADGDGVITPEDVEDHERADRLLRRLERLDSDGDGRVTLTELEQAQLRARERADRSGDGELSRRARHLAARKGGFQAKDADGDGRLSPAEFAGKGEIFRRLDADGDGLILRSQLDQGERAGRKLQRFDRLDANHDGRLTREEIRAFQQARFERLDADADGFLSREESRTGRERRTDGREL
jgi:Ca2+-binding EF-hand superfamily protein